MLFLCLVLQFIVVTVRASVHFEDCGSAYDIQSVYIEGCGARLPCYVTLGYGTLVEVKFVADFVSLQLDQNVTIKINYVDSQAPVTPEPCETLECPVRTYAATALSSIMSVPTDMASNQRGHLQWRMYNENGEQVICYSVLVQTQTPQERNLKLFHSGLDDYIKSRIIEFYKQKLINKTLDREGYFVMQRFLRNWVVGN
ncbi:uncharacterized protein LOC123662476 [Melitaea cinxia]|uniref:uncharacterized protein LOC123662476 n=1 Tax=Melitaea cinxia TaxID=113334 RepID=UPI001E273427|nr:uncharacterized protein LOC123662476 [Melitaea cinxia]